MSVGAVSTYATEALKPSTGLSIGEKCYVTETNSSYTATSATTWGPYSHLMPVAVVLNHQKTIKQLSDFPTPIAGVITLIDNTDYIINDSVDIGTNVIKVGANNSILGNDRFKDILISSTTGNMITIGSVSAPYYGLICKVCRFQCPNGTLFSGTNQGLTMDFCFVDNTKNLGDFTSITNTVSLALFKNNFSNLTGRGFVFSGSLGLNVRIALNLVVNNAGTFLDFGTSIFQNLFISKNIVTVNATQTFMSGLTANGNISNGGLLSNNIFSGVGTPVNTIAATDSKWVFADNVGLTNTNTFTIFSQTNSVTVANTATETSLLGTGIGTLTIPANRLVLGQSFNIRIRGFRSRTSGNETYKVKFGGTTILTTGAVLLGAGANDGFDLDCELTVRTLGATGTIIGQGKMVNLNNGNTFELVSTAAVAINTTISNVFDVTAQWGTANAGNTITSTNSKINN